LFAIRQLFIATVRWQLKPLTEHSRPIHLYA